MSKTLRAEPTFTRTHEEPDHWCNNGWASWLHQTMEDLDREAYEPLATEQEVFTEEDAWAALALDYEALDALERTNIA